LKWENNCLKDYSNLFTEIKDNLNTAREAFIKASFVDDDAQIRSVNEAEMIFNCINHCYLKLKDLFSEYPSLESLFVKEFGEIPQTFNRESLLEICFIEEFLFPENDSYPFVPGQEVEQELLDNYLTSFSEWCDEIKDTHVETQELIKEKFNLDISHSDLECHCTQCLADYRARTREHIFEDQVKLIDEAEEKLHDFILTAKIDQVSDEVSRLKRKLEKNLHSVKYKLKRASLNKLDAEVKSHFKYKFSYQSELAKVYKEKLRAYFNLLLDESDIKPELVTDEEFFRFFSQLNTNIWKHSKYLKREFKKMINAVMALKRKDISSTILRDYLGMFWLHSEARKKNRKVIYHMGPTNSGKTYNAIEALSKAEKGCYLAPLRLLASELFDTLNAKGCATTLLTGEEVVEIENATHTSSTIEMAKLHDEFDVCVIDEIQMIADSQRGWAWTRALINMNADEVHLCGDHSVLELVEQILKLTGDTLEIRNYERKTKLDVEDRTIKLTDLKENDALIVFSRRNALKYKMDLENLGYKVSIVYGRLSPEVRREQARKFDHGETDIMVSTDAIAMGMNLPVRRIVFSTLSKFINSKEHFISESEIKQIAGRAGRFGRFPEGKVNCLQKVDDGLERVNMALHCELPQKEVAMVGPDQEIFQSVNNALEENGLNQLKLSEFLRLFNTMTFEKPFFCVELKEMIELAETIEDVDEDEKLSLSEIFGFACAPVNLGLVDHVQYYVWILNHFVKTKPIYNEPIDEMSTDIDYLETAIKCVELYQWLARHFDNKNFEFSEADLLGNKSLAVEKLNQLLSEKISRRCSSCGVKLAPEFRFNICETCFGERRFSRPRRGGQRDGQSNDRLRSKKGGKKKSSKKTGSGPSRRGKVNRSKSTKKKASAFKKHR
jgi:ATP-dependent RNA helicase SUPV3L1/SUV3